MKSSVVPKAVAVIALAAGVGVGLPTDAAVMVAVATDSAPAGGADHDPYSPVLFSASGDDLAEGLMAAYDGDATFEGSLGVSAWTNGSVDTVYAQGGPGGDDIDHAGYGGVTDGASAKFDLGVLADLSRVDVYPAWNDTGRDLLSFDLLASADDVSYTQIATFLKGVVSDGLPSTPTTHQVSITDGMGDLATGVRYVRLDFFATDNGAAGIAEIDILGARVPEPSAAVIGIVAVVASAFRRSPR